MTWKERIERLRAVPGGRLEVRDFFPAGRPPYRYAELKVAMPSPDADWRPAVAAVEAAIATDGHATVWTHYETLVIEVCITRPLEPDEIEGVEVPCLSRPVEVP
jgi:hypothetical protein